MTLLKTPKYTYKLKSTKSGSYYITKEMTSKGLQLFYSGHIPNQGGIKLIIDKWTSYNNELKDKNYYFGTK